MTDKPNPVGLKKESSGHPTDHSRKALQEFAYRCVKELDYVQSSFEACGSNLCASAVGKELVEEGMKLLGVKDLSTEDLPPSLPEEGGQPASEALLDLEEWLLDQIDGGEERRGRDTAITRHIETIRNLREAGASTLGER